MQNGAPVQAAAPFCLELFGEVSEVFRAAPQLFRATGGFCCSEVPALLTIVSALFRVILSMEQRKTLKGNDTADDDLDGVSWRGEGPQMRPRSTPEDPQ